MNAVNSSKLRTGGVEQLETRPEDMARRCGRRAAGRRAATGDATGAALRALSSRIMEQFEGESDAYLSQPVFVKTIAKLFGLRSVDVGGRAAGALQRAVAAIFASWDIASLGLTITEIQKILTKGGKVSVAKKAKKDAIFQAELTTGSPESDRKKERKDRATKLSEAKQSLHGFVIKTRDEQLQQRAERVAPVQLEALMDAMGRNSKSVLDLFLKWDTDGNGMVSAEEFAFAVARLGFKFSKEVTDELFAFFDKDGSDAVSIDEIQAAPQMGQGAEADAAAARRLAAALAHAR